MAPTWIPTKQQRPDPYIDWKHRVEHQSKREEHWCSVSIRVPSEDPLPHLVALKAMAEAAVDLKMTDDEYRLLVRTIGELEQATRGGQPVDLKESALRYFVYMPEAQIYNDGDFKSSDHFEITFASPPIPSLTKDRKFQLHTADPGAIAARDAQNSTKPRVAVAVIDDGIGFANQRVLDALGTRVAAIWLQDVETHQVDGRVAFGSRIEGAQLEEINKQIVNGVDEMDIYRQDGVEMLDFSQDRHQSMAYRVSHGTHVMDLAAGSDPGSSEQVDWPILAVQLPTPVTADTSGVTLASYVLQALRTVILWADRLGDQVPLIVNFSYGYSAGPKDGTSLIEQEIDRMVCERNKEGSPTLLVLPSGNNYLSRTTAHFRLVDQQPREIDWVIPPDDPTDNFIEIWIYDDKTASGPSHAEAPIAVRLTTPHGELGPVQMPRSGEMKVLEDSKGPIAGLYYHQFAAADDPTKIKHRVFLAVGRTRDLESESTLAPSGTWKISIERNSTEPVEAWCYIQRDDTPVGFRRFGRQSYLHHENAYGWDKDTASYTKLGKASDDDKACPITHERTMTAIGNGAGTLVVGGVIDDRCWPPAEYAASGSTPTRFGPLVSAVTDDSHVLAGVMASGTRSGTHVAMRGTSVAAPQVTRFLAHWLANNDAATNASLAQGSVGNLADTVERLVRAEINTQASNGSGQRLELLPKRDERRGFAVITKPRSADTPPRRYPSRP